jgi:hypothetical protein
MSIAQDIIQDTSTAVRSGAEKFGLYTLTGHHYDVVRSDAAFSELLIYCKLWLLAIVSELTDPPMDNTQLCVEQSPSPQLPVTIEKTATISPEAAHQLPRDILNCLLGVSAVHMAARNPGNLSIERLSLETKVGLFQSIKNLFKYPGNQRADVLLTCITLMFAMDVSVILILVYLRCSRNLHCRATRSETSRRSTELHTTRRYLITNYRTGH